MPFFVPVKNAIIEWRYKPNLSVYAKMDSVGIALSKEYPDWQRSALALELRNKKHRRRFHISHRRCFFEVIQPSDNNVIEEIERGQKAFEKLAAAIDVTKIDRIGLRQWAAFDTAEPFQKMVARFTAKIHSTDKRLTELHRGSVSDIAYVVDVKTPDGWSYNLKAGPMKREQWFEIIPHEIGLFESQEKFDELKSGFPESFLFVDIDCYHEDLTTADFKQKTSRMRSMSHEIATDFYRYIEGV